MRNFDVQIKSLKCAIYLQTTDSKKKNRQKKTSWPADLLSIDFYQQKSRTKKRKMKSLSTTQRNIESIQHY